MAFQDQTLTCRDCGKQFVWTASEQEFYQQKGFQNAPVRCPEDRAAKKARMDGRGPRQMHEITCANCGRHDTVPFEPRGDRPVLCGDCFRLQRDGKLDMSEVSSKSKSKDKDSKEESHEDEVEDKEVEPQEEAEESEADQEEKADDNSEEEPKEE